MRWQPSPKRASVTVWNDFLRALSLLTVLPVHPDWDAPTPLGRTMAFYPAIGLGIGGLLAGWAALLGWVMGETIPPAPLRAALILVAWVTMTGGLHLDGWGDACDALLVTADRARRLEILHDPHLGSFGVLGVTLLLIVKWASLQYIQGLMPLILIPTLARWAIVLAAARWPSARPGGMGDRFRQGLGWRQIAVATLTAVVITGAAGMRGGIAVLGTLIVTVGLAQLAIRRLGGLTGDIYGAIVEGVEVFLLLMLALMEHIAL